ncbi:MAG: patatin-like phospholipase family protein [Longilinea sp.]|nr:patatin-like phospholipase family protein [Longilinea sp.]
MATIRALVLSGGGGRGAFHAGVYRYLMQSQKPGVDAQHQQPWTPDIVVGTSIGAVNGAAIVQGISADELQEFWVQVRERDIEGLPPGMSWLSRRLINRVMKKMIGASLGQVPAQEATSYIPDWWQEALPGLGKLGDWALGRWCSLLDTGPLRRTLEQRLKIDPGKIEHSQQTLLINATRVATGERVIFSNRTIRSRSTGKPRRDVVQGINVQRILASCSIPMVYPWTHDEETKSLYWDGAVVSNTPLGAALDAAADRPPDDEMEVVVALMTPWTSGEDEDASPPLPRDFSQAVTYALDWMLLASFRERLALIESFNRLAQLGREKGDELLSRYRFVHVHVVAPNRFYDAARIIDYDERNKSLIADGYRATEQVFRQAYPAAEAVGAD